MDSLTLATVFGLGAAWGYLCRVLQTLPKHPLRLLPRTLFAFSPPVAIEDPIYRARWRLATLRYIGLCEDLTRHDANPRKLPGRERLGEATGHTWRTFQVYNRLLEDGGLVANLGSAGRYWLVSKHERRAMLSALPYPPDRHPPSFPWGREGM